MFAYRELINFFKEKRLNHNSDSLLWWTENQEKDPKLANLAHRYLAAPPTSVPFKRLFSGTDIIYGPPRNRISGSSVEK